MGMKIRREFIVVFKFVMAFGFMSWFFIYLKFKLKSRQQFKVPGIRYPFTLRSEVSDRRVFYELFVDLDRHFLDQIENPVTIIDGGANIGLNAIICKNKFPQASIICIEPDDQNIQLLKQNIAPYQGILVEHAGLWNKDIDLRVSDKYGLGKSGLIVEEVHENGNVRGMTISSIMKKYAISTIDLLKLDIETSERYLFADHYQDWLPHVKVVLIELHDRMAAGCSKSFFEAINATFKSYRFAQYGEYTLVVNTTAEV
jgi:FkbM family methyltransferase